MFSSATFNVAEWTPAMMQSPAQASENATQSAHSLNGLADLYQEIIVEHSRRPRFKGRIEGCKFCQEGKNPLCGDQITIFCKTELVPECTAPRLFAHFDGTGCSISQASASMMCDALQGVDVLKARAVLRHAENIYTGKQALHSIDDVEEDVEALFGVSKFPVRIKCAALAWKTLELILNEHFDEQGNFKVATAEAACGEIRTCATIRKLKVVSTES